VQNVATAPRPAADVAMRRLLRIPEGHTVSEGAAQRAFSTSVLVSATRCILTYLVLPFLLPALGLAAGVGPAIGIPVGLVAIAANVATIRRFWAADHRWRWAYTALAAMVIVLLVVLLVEDVGSLVG
jgi:hypothetical protein